jgi:hypothetical protein
VLCLRYNNRGNSSCWWSFQKTIRSSRWRRSKHCTHQQGLHGFLWLTRFQVLVSWNRLRIARWRLTLEMNSGTEYSTQCYCSNTIDTSSGGGQLRADSDCNMKCAGNSTEMCGSAGMLSISLTAGTSPSTAPSTPGFVGCYAPGSAALANPLYEQASRQISEVMVER